MSSYFEHNNRIKQTFTIYPKSLRSRIAILVNLENIQNRYPHIYLIQSKRKRGFIQSCGRINALHIFLTECPDELSNCFESSKSEITFEPRGSKVGDLFFTDIYIKIIKNSFVESNLLTIPTQKITQMTINVNDIQHQTILNYQKVSGDKFPEKALQRMLTSVSELLNNGKLTGHFKKYIRDATGHRFKLVLADEPILIPDTRPIEDRDFRPGKIMTPMRSYGKSPIKEALEDFRKLKKRGTEMKSLPDPIDHNEDLDSLSKIRE